MTPEQIAKANAELRSKSPLEIVKWAIAQANGRAIVSTNYRPYEAVILHLVTQVQPDIPVLWVDHGYNRPATYRHAEQVKKLLKLNIKAFVPRMTAAHYDAAFGGMPEPTPENEAQIKAFSTAMKLEPFQRGMKELARPSGSQRCAKCRIQTAPARHRERGQKFQIRSRSAPCLLERRRHGKYLAQHNLPNEWDYFDPRRPMRNASAVFTRVGAEKLSKAARESDLLRQ